MKTYFFIARRYFLSKKSHNVVNILSWISLSGVFVATMGLVVVLSVFNGFSDLVVSLYDSFDPDIKVTPVAGKTFEPRPAVFENVLKVEGVSAISASLEENALVKYGDRQFIAVIKGVDSNFSNVNSIEPYIVEGAFTVSDSGLEMAVLGSIIAYSLGVNVNDPLGSLNIYVPKKGQNVNTLDPTSAFNNGLLKPAGIFAIQQDFDSRYILVPIKFARRLLDQDTRISALEISLEPGIDEEQAMAQISTLLGDQYKVKTRLMQHDFLYKILKSEKWAVFLILSLILVIAIFNIIGSLTMLIIEKKKDVAVLKAMGATRSFVRMIFLTEGMIIVMTGALAGMMAGFVICYLQQQFGFIKLENAESFIIDSYPVAMQLMDFAGVFAAVILIGFSAAYYTSRNLVDKEYVRLA